MRDRRVVLGAVVNRCSKMLEMISAGRFMSVSDMVSCESVASATSGIRVDASRSSNSRC